MLMSPGYPGVIRGVVAVGKGEFIVCTASGTVARYKPAQMESEVLAHGLDQVYGVALAPRGGVVVAELGAGRVLSVKDGQVEVLASGLRNPMGVAFGSDGVCFVSESSAGRVVKLTGSGVDTVLDDLWQPQGILVRDGKLYVV